MSAQKLNLSDLKSKSPKDLLSMAEELEIENASTMRKGEMMFQILRERADEGWEVFGEGVLEVLQDGFGFLRAPEANYLPGPDDIYVSPEIIRQFSLRTGDTVEGMIKAPDENERYFAIVGVNQINFEDPQKAKHKIAFDNLTPLYPDERLTMEIEDPTVKDRSARVIDLVAPIGKGQRSLIVAPPRTGKTVILQNIAHSIERNHPECYLIVLLIDEGQEAGVVRGQQPALRGAQELHGGGRGVRPPAGAPVPAALPRARPGLRHRVRDAARDARAHAAHARAHARQRGEGGPCRAVPARHGLPHGRVPHRPRGQEAVRGLQR